MTRTEFDALYKEYDEARKEIARECEAEGYPIYGDNYELRIEALKHEYPELFEEDIEIEDDYREEERKQKQAFEREMSKNHTGHAELYGWFTNITFNFIGTEIITEQFYDHDEKKNKDENLVVLRLDAEHTCEIRIYDSDTDIYKRSETETETVYELEGGIDGGCLTLYIRK